MWLWQKATISQNAPKHTPSYPNAFPRRLSKLMAVRVFLIPTVDSEHKKDSQLPGIKPGAWAGHVN